ncbi:unnamed protein product [Owenia fusiformis]|uniref:Uncharacterized protein n=1 Tax=Owenia fusiformis TaxID=6347 RepID=A0A8J1XU82_OWEFU|nr:unnamed protein product [Owenia fusiformis]
MATASKASDDDNYKEVLTCPVCLELLSDPRVTPCMHTICLKCLDSWIVRQRHEKPGGTSCPCPVCTEPFDVPAKGATAFKGNYIINDMLTAVRKKLDKKIETKNCEICSTEDEPVVAKLKCVDCDQMMCDGCGNLHQKLNSTKHHTTLQLSGDSDKDMSLLPKRVKFCAEHGEEPLKFYCKSCEKVVCRDCCVTTHSGHKFEDLSSKVKAGLKSINSMIELSRKRAELIEAVVDETRIKREDMKNVIVDVRAELEASRLAKHTIIDAHYDDEVAKLDKMYESNEKKVDAHVNSLEIEKDIASNEQQVCSQQLYLAPAAVVEMQDVLNQKIQQWSITLDFQFKDDVAVAFKEGKDPMELGKITVDEKDDQADEHQVACPTEANNKSIKKDVEIEQNDFPFKGVTSIAFLNNGDLVTAEGIDGVKIRDPNNFQEKAQIAIHSSPEIAITPDGEILTKDDFTKKMLLFDKNGKLVGALKHIGNPEKFTVSKNGEFVVSHETKLSKYSRNFDNGTPLFTWGSWENMDSLACDSKNNIVIRLSDYIRIISMDGETLCTFCIGDGYRLDSFDNILTFSNGYQKCGKYETKCVTTVSVYSSKGKLMQQLVEEDSSPIDGYPTTAAVDKNGHLIILVKDDSKYRCVKIKYLK